MLQVDVCNLGHDDYGPPQELIVLRRYGLILHPRAVVWFFFEGNDLIDLEDHQNATTAWRGYLTRGNSIAARSFCLNALQRLDLWIDPWRWHDPGLLRTPTARLLPSMGDGQVVMYFGGYYRWGLPDLSPRELALLAKTQDVLQQSQSLCNQQQIEFLVVNVPTKFRVYRDLCMPGKDSKRGRWHLNDLPDRLDQWCAAAGIEYLDLTPALKSAAEEGPLVYFAEDGHWTAHGHAVVADEIAGFLRKAGWLVSDER